MAKKKLQSSYAALPLDSDFDNSNSTIVDDNDSKNSHKNALASSTMSLPSTNRGIELLDPSTVKSGPGLAYPLNEPGSLKASQSMSNLSVYKKNPNLELSAGDSDSDLAKKKKRNISFHKIFPSVPEDDLFIDDFTCALQENFLIQGKMYITVSHICFNANIFGYKNSQVIPLVDILSIDRKKTAKVFDNALSITTSSRKYIFTSFLNREYVYELILECWTRLKESELGMEYDTDSSSTKVSDAVSFTENENSITPPNNISPPLSSSPEIGQPGLPSKVIGTENTENDQCCSCPCKEHFDYVAVDCVYENVNVEKVFELIHGGYPNSTYSSLHPEVDSFLWKLMEEKSKFGDVNISEWNAVTKDNGETALMRNISYKKPINFAVGPKFAECEIVEEILHKDIPKFSVVKKTVATPNVPGGSSFKTIVTVCISRVSKYQTRLLVTLKVDFSQKPIFRALIEKATKDGTKKYYEDLSHEIFDLCQQYPDPCSPGTASIESGEICNKKDNEKSQFSPQKKVFQSTPSITSPKKLSPSNSSSISSSSEGNLSFFTEVLLFPFQPSPSHLAVVYTLLFVLLLSYMSLLQRVAQLESMIATS